MEENIEQTINDYISNLPPEVEKRLSGDWRNRLSEELQRNNIPEQYHQNIRTEVFANLAGLLRQDEVCQNIRKMLPMDSRALGALCDNLRNKILVKIDTEEEKKPGIPTESQVGVDIIEERETLEPEVAPMQSSATESSAGVDILQEEKVTEENRPSPAKDSLIQGIEHPEEAGDIEDAAEQGKKYNPIKSKLGGSTGNRAPQYKGTDPYREPIE